MLLELIGRRASSIRASRRERRTFRITATRSRPIRSTPARLRRVVELAAEQAGWGKKLPPGHGWASPRIAASCQLRRDRRRGRGRRQGQADGAARRYRDRLRLCRQPRAHPLADRGGGGDGAQPRQIRRDHVQERARRSRTISTASRWPASTRRRAITHVHIIPAGIEVPVERGRRAGAAALRAGAVQRDLRRDRQAHPAVADRRSAGELSPEREGSLRAAPSGDGLFRRSRCLREDGEDVREERQDPSIAGAGSRGEQRCGVGTGPPRRAASGRGPGGTRTRAAAARAIYWSRSAPTIPSR